MPAVDTVSFLDFHIDPFNTAAFSPVIQIVKRVLEIKTRPDLVSRSLSPFDPSAEGQVGCVVNSLGFLQRSSHDAATAAGDRGSAAAGIRMLEDEHTSSRPSLLDCGGNTRSSTADDDYICFDP